MTLPTKRKLSLSLSTDADLHFSIPVFLHHEFSYARSLEHGLASGLNPEFNHQYRVALRRARSLCLLLKEALPPFELSILKPNLKLLMKQTNQLRDLDVFMLGKAAYFAMLPKREASLNKVFAHIEARQHVEQSRVRFWLQSDGYQKTGVLLNNSLNRAISNDADTLQNSTLSFSNGKVLNHFKKVIKASKKLSPTSPDDAIHRLRIECKKLRYLLEYFSDLYTDARHNSNIKHLKHLQNSLGDFNDTSSQLAFFRQLRKSNVFGKEEQQTVKALIKKLKMHHFDARLSVLNHFKDFQRAIHQNASLSIYCC
ncbi:CHAD domain-containing protein [Vibrio alfacsensis]|uniref:CHAD domain-containing protein n=1 Tax=Vibrio alfacsensis TaxID=1074311 RepID=UPI0040692EF3